MPVTLVAGSWPSFGASFGFEVTSQHTHIVFSSELLKLIARSLAITIQPVNCTYCHLAFIPQMGAFAARRFGCIVLNDTFRTNVELVRV